MAFPKVRRLLVALLLLLFPTAILVGKEMTAPVLPLNVQMMIEVWKAFDQAKKTRSAQDYEVVITRADALIEEFQAGAIAGEKRLIETKAKVPNFHAGPLDKFEQDRVSTFGPLSEVSASFLVKGRVLEAQGKSAAALAAYEQAEQYVHATIYDPANSYWSPAEDAASRKALLLKRLEDKG